MRKVGDMQVYTHEEMLDRVLGKKGTPERDEHEAKIEAFLLGEAIKEARLSKNITQEELSEKLGVKRAQISRIEKGCNASLSTLSKVFKALGVGASLNVDGVGTVALA